MSKLMRNTWKRFDLRKSHVGTKVMSDSEFVALLGYLNNIGRHSEQKRIVGVLEAMLKLEKSEEPLWGETKEEMEFSSGTRAQSFTVIRHGLAVANPALLQIAPTKYLQQVEFDNLRFFIDRELARNRFIPRLWKTSRGQWVLIWRIASRGAKRLKATKDGIEFGDGDAIQSILTFAQAGKLNRLRRCARCNEWLYANFIHQNFCSTSCQQKYYSKSFEWKAKRREYMRNYRKR
jgi:hypothetical protein